MEAEELLKAAHTDIVEEHRKVIDYLETLSKGEGPITEEEMDKVRNGMTGVLKKINDGLKEYEQKKMGSQE